MFNAIVNKAENAAHDLARDAGITLLVVVMQFGAVLFIFGGVAWALASVIPPPVALIATGAALGLTAAVTLAVKRNGGTEPSPKEEKSPKHGSPSALIESVASVAGAFDVAAAGLFTRQLQRRPVSTIAATVAAGVLLGILTDAGEEED